MLCQLVFWAMRSNIFFSFSCAAGVSAPGWDLSWLATICRMLSIICFCICSIFISVSSSSTLASLVPLTEPMPPPPQAVSVSNKAQIPLSFIFSPVPNYYTRLGEFAACLSLDLQMHDPRNRRGLVVQKHDPTRLGKRQPTLNGAGIERELAQDLPIGRVLGVREGGLREKSAAPAEGQQARRATLAGFGELVFEAIHARPRLRQARRMRVLVVKADQNVGAGLHVAVQPGCIGSFVTP